VLYEVSDMCPNVFCFMKFLICARTYFVLWSFWYVPERIVFYEVSDKSPNVFCFMKFLICARKNCVLWSFWYEPEIIVFYEVSDMSPNEFSCMQNTALVDITTFFQHLRYIYLTSNAFILHFLCLHEKSTNWTYTHPVFPCLFHSNVITAQCSDL
jgi:hypothetical protein